jgi:archaellum component FlaG (FlaF/FlaG flagellin family)
MGFSGMASQVIMFIAVITVTTVLVIVFNGYVNEASNSLNIKNDYLSKQMKTDISIDVVSYDSSSDTTYIYVKNTGKISLKLNDTDVYLNGFRIPRSDTNRSIEVLSDTDTINPGTWDPKEEVLVKVYQALSSSTSHKVIVSTQYDASDMDEFSI